VDRIPSRPPPTQRVEVKAWLIERFEGRRAVDRRQANQGAAVQIDPHAAASAGLEQLSQSAVPKAFDHSRAKDVKRHLTGCQAAPYNSAPKGVGGFARKAGVGA
jgi:hypothetical protein